MASVKLNEEKYNIRSTFRSVSVDDLEKVVKKLIEAALEDDEETIQLEMLVLGEDYYRKFAKIKPGNSESKHISKISNCSKESEKTKEKNLENDAFSKINNSPAKIVPSEEETDKKLDQDSTFITLIECSTTSRYPETEEKESIENCHETKEIKSKHVKPTVKKNLRSKLTKDPETDKKEKGILSQGKNQSKGDFSFEAWKAAKTRTYKQTLKEERRKRHRELLENAKKLERERAAHMVYLNWKRDQQQQQKLKRMRVKADNKTIMASKIISDEKRSENSKAFKEWKKRKDAKIRREKMMWRAYCQQYNQQYISVPPVQRESCKPETNIDFDSWLDQVDHVLHQKYVRERRFQVRSFYCQPTYYGAAASIQK